MASPIESAINAVVQPVANPRPSKDGLPHVTHSGVLELLPGLKLNVFRLSNGQAIVDEESMERFAHYMLTGGTVPPDLFVDDNAEGEGANA